VESKDWCERKLPGKRIWLMRTWWSERERERRRMVRWLCGFRERERNETTCNTNSLQFSFPLSLCSSLSLFTLLATLHNTPTINTTQHRSQQKQTTW